MFGIDFFYMVSQSTIIIKMVLLVLLIMSIASWTIIFFHFFQLMRAKKTVAQDLHFMRKAGNLRAAIKKMQQTPDSPSFLVTLKGLKELKRIKSMGEYYLKNHQTIMDSLRRTLKLEVNVQTERLFGSLSFLATAVNVAPLLGLFGTVWGIMNSFHSFKGLTTSNLGAIAPGMAEALVTTAFGLVVAIPAALAYNILIRQLTIVSSNLMELTDIFLKQVEKEVIEQA